MAHRTSLSSPGNWLLLLSVFGVPPLLGLPFSQYDLFPSLFNTGSGLGGNICNAPWQQTWGRDLQMCWETSSASSWGSQAFRIRGGGAPLSPLSDTGCKECPGLNGPCVKMWDGGQSPSTPLQAGPEQEAAQGLGCTHSQSLAPYGERPSQTLPGVFSHSTPYIVA